VNSAAVIRKPNWTREITRGIGLYELCAGVFGILQILEAAPKVVHEMPAAVRRQATLLYVLYACVFGVVSLAGALLLKSKWRHSRWLTVVVQAIQIPTWSSQASSYLFLGGIYAAVLWQQRHAIPLIGWSVSLQIGWADSAGKYFGLNFMPLVVLALLRYSRVRQLSGMS
jgi:hypothetical protein